MIVIHDLSSLPLNAVSALQFSLFQMKMMDNLKSAKCDQKLQVLRSVLDFQLIIIQSYQADESLRRDCLCLAPSPPHFSCVNIESLIQDCLLVTQLSGQVKASTKLVAVVDDDVRRDVYLELCWVRRFIFNLLSNAVRATTLGHIRLHVSTSDMSIHDMCTDLQVSSDKGQALKVLQMIQFAVRDTGCGIAPADVGTIFKKRFSSSGMNVGLWAMSEHVKILGGKCGYSTPTDGDGGSEFYFIVPTFVYC